MKKWIISGAVSFLFLLVVIVYLRQFLLQDQCLDAGGSWQGAINGCDGGTYESSYFVITPIGAVILAGIWLFSTWLISFIYSKLSSANANT